MGLSAFQEKIRSNRGENLARSPCTASSSCICCCKKEQVNWGKSDRSATILEILHPRNMAEEKMLHKKVLVNAVDETNRMRAEKSGRATQPV